MNKSEARTHYKNLRKSLSEEDIQTQSLAILENMKRVSLLNHTYFHVFLPIKKNNEVNTYPIIEYLFQQNKKIVLPKVDGDKLINCLVDKDFKTKLNDLYIPEPINYKVLETDLLEVVLLPLFVCDEKGNRVGYGEGFYDRFLSDCKKDTLKIGLNFYSPIADISDANQYDIALDYLLTPAGIVSFGAGSYFKY